MNMENSIKILNIDDILPNRFQPRIQFNDSNLNELSESIKEHGVIQPIVVRKISDKYEIIAGERRYKASILAGKTTIPAIITDLNDKDSAEIALIENVQRQDLTPIEEAVSYRKILDMGYITQTELADKLGKTQSTIANKLRLLNLADEVQEALLVGKISERHARSLLKLQNEDQINMLNRIISERLTVRRTDEEVDKLLNASGEQKQIEEEKVDMTMNDEIKNEFNIPSNPIYNEDPKPIEPIVTPSINPGFMDIDKIETTAEDIFKEKEPVDLDSLLENKNPQPEPISVAQPIPEPEEQKTGGKFFNMFHFNQPEENPNYVENVEKEETNLDFGIPKREESAFNPFTIDSGIEENNEPEPLAATLDKTIDNVDNTQNNDSFEIKENLFGESAFSFGQSNTENSTAEINPIEDDPSNYDIIGESSFKTTEVVQSQEEDLFTSVNPYHLNDDADFTMKIPVNEINDALNNANGETEEGTNSIIQPDISSSSTFTNEQLETDSILEDTQNRYVTADFKTVINTIRECSATIQKYGYAVEVEELDLDGKYQIIFNIEK